MLGPVPILLPGHAMDCLHVGRHDVPSPLHTSLSLTQATLELAAGDLRVAIGAHVLLECHPMVTSVTHEAGGLVELVATDLALILTPVQFEMLHVGDDRFQGLDWL